MKNLPLLIGSLALTLLVVIGVAVLFTQKASVPAVPVDSKYLVSDAIHSKGPDNAKVTVEEFSDFQCPACSAAQPYLNQILQKYDGKIKFVYRFFPLRNIHANSVVSARAAEAASKQSAFWGYHDTLFAKQNEWADEKDPTAKFVQYASDLKLNTDQFQKDLKDANIEARIDADEKDANTIGVNATPTFYVNGVMTDLSALDGAINTSLNQ